MTAKLNFDGFSSRVYLFGNNYDERFSVSEVDFLRMIQEFNRQKQIFIKMVSRPRSYVPQEEPNNSSRLDKIICLLEKIERRIK